MANKTAIIESELSTEHKVTALMLCIAQEKKVEITRLIQHTNLSILQLNILHSLSKSPEGHLTVNQIKQLMIDESPNVSRALNKLVDSGYIKKQRSEQDQRIVHIHITSEGEQAHVDADSSLLTMELGLSASEAEDLYRLLVKL